MPKHARTIRAIGAPLGLASLLALSACGLSNSSSGEASPEDPLRIFATPTPQGDILEFIQELAEEDGSNLSLDITASQSDLDPNELLAQGDIDVNLFQHQPYFSSWQSAHENVTDLVPIATLLVNVFGLYSTEYSDPAAIPDGTEILVPNEQTNLPRALFILQDQGLIELDHPTSDGSTDAIAIDESNITSNPKNLVFLPTDTVLRAQSLPDVAASFINGDIALTNDVDASNALALEDSEDNPYANIAVTREELVEDPRVQELKEYLLSQEVADYIEENYDGLILPTQEDL